MNTRRYKARSAAFDTGYAVEIRMAPFTPRLSVTDGVGKRRCYVTNRSSLKAIANAILKSLEE